MSIGDLLVSIFNSIGGLVCHQLPGRTLRIGGGLLFVCARDTGFYIGFLIGLSLLHKRRRAPCGPRNLYFTLGLMLPMIIDGATQAVGLRTSNNSLRLLTGLFFGTALSPFLLYLLSVIPTARRTPIIGRIVPREVRMEDRVSWLPVRVLVLGAMVDVGIFLLVRSLVGTANRIFFWGLSFTIMASLVIVIFVFPAMLAVFLIRFAREAVRGR